MIRRVRVQNYRSLRSITVGLEPLTVLVGANASGKSNFFSAMQARCHGQMDAWGRAPRTPIGVVVEGDFGKSGWGAVDGPANLQSHYPTVQLLQLELGNLRSQVQVAELRRLDTVGDGLANLFQTLTRKERDQIARQYCALVPMFSDVDARPLSAGSHRVVFQDRWRNDIWYEPDQVSDGSILLLAYLLLPHQSPPPDLIAIEEPERGLHPYLMNELVKALRDLANGKFGKPVQVVLATHSAQLLDCVEAKEVRFFSRSKETGETRVEAAPIDSPDWRKIFTEYNDSLGGIWLSGGLGGVP